LLLLNTGHITPLKRLAVSNEAFKWECHERVVVRRLPFDAELPNREAALRIAERRCPRGRLQQHPGRHARLPALHRLAEYSEIYPACAQVSRKGEAIRSRTDDRDIDRHGHP